MSFGIENGSGQSDARLSEYVLFGPPDAPGTRTCLLLSLEYLLSVQPVFGFRPEEAAAADHVLIVGNDDAVSATMEAGLLAGGCQVTRITGDSHSMEAQLRSRMLAIEAD